MLKKETAPPGLKKMADSLSIKGAIRSAGRVPCGRPLPACLQGLNALVGRKHVFRDKQSIQLVRLTGIHLNDEYFKFDLAAISAPGFLAIARRPFSIECHAEYLAIERTYCFASIVGCFLITDARVVKRLIDFAASRPTAGAFLREINSRLRSASEEH